MIDSALRAGNKQALYELLPYMDSNARTIEYLGYHRMETTKSVQAKRLIIENCSFLPRELDLKGIKDSRDLLGFLQKNIDSIVFVKAAQAFVITPFEQRDVHSDIQMVSQRRLKEVRDRAEAIMLPAWIRDHGIDTAIQAHNPVCLLMIASEYLRQRSRFNEYYFDQGQFKDLLELLTGSTVAVKDGRGQLTWHFETDYSDESRLNLMIYFAQNYKYYTWDGSRGIFTMPLTHVRVATEEQGLFEQLSSHDKKEAMEAFIALTTSDPAVVVPLAQEYDRSSLRSNFELPIFAFRFLQQLPLLTGYCRSNNLDYEGSPELRADIDRLKGRLSFADRFKLENKLIDSLTLYNITALEYWTLIYEQSYYLTYSTGRILDVFYSRHWQEMLTETRYLDMYLKKSNLYDHLGIIGICNNYRNKFTGTLPAVLSVLPKHSTSDDSVKAEITKVMQVSSLVNTSKKASTFKYEWDGNKEETVNLDIAMRPLTMYKIPSEGNDDKISSVMAKVSYRQIGKALSMLEDCPFQVEWKKYSFMDRDWGFMPDSSFSNKAVRDTFLVKYNTLSEYDLYSYYLDKSGIDYKYEDGSLDYDRMYDLLKYDVVVAFVGGGGGINDREVYSLVKLLELKHHTTLGFPDKLCHSNNIYGCDSEHQADAWREYMEKQGLLHQKHNDPVSFHFHIR